MASDCVEMGVSHRSTCLLVAMPLDGTAVETAREHAEKSSIDFDEVREVETDSPGVTVRLLETDAEDEKDSLFAQVDFIAGPMENEMFEKRLNNAIGDLREYLDGQTGDRVVEDEEEFTMGSDPEEDETKEDETKEDEKRLQAVDDETSQSEMTSTTSRAGKTNVDVEISMSDEMESEFQGIASQDQLADIEERLSEFDDRITRLEDVLSVLGDFSSGEK